MHSLAPRSFLAVAGTELVLALALDSGWLRRRRTERCRSFGLPQEPYGMHSLAPRSFLAVAETELVSVLVLALDFGCLCKRRTERCRSFGSRRGQYDRYPFETRRCRTTEQWQRC